MTPEKLTNTIAMVTGLDADAIKDSVEASPEAALASYQDYRRTLNAEALAATFIDGRDNDKKDHDGEQIDSNDS